MDRAELSQYVRDVPDFPEAGILFRDLTPLFLAPKAFAATVEAVAAPFVGASVDRVLGIESRGFILGAPVVQRWVQRSLGALLIGFAARLATTDR